MKQTYFYIKRLSQITLMVLAIFCFSMFVSSCDGDGSGKKKDDTEKKDEPKKDEKKEVTPIYWRPIANTKDLPKNPDMKCGDSKTFTWTNAEGYDYITVVIQNTGTCKVSYSITNSNIQVDKKDLVKQKVPVESGGQQVRTQDAPAKGSSVDITFTCESVNPTPKCNFSFQISGGFKKDPGDGKGISSVSGNDMKGLVPPAHKPMNKKKPDPCITDPLTFLEFINMSATDVSVSYTVTNQCKCKLKITGDNGHARKDKADTTSPPDYMDPFKDPQDDVDITKPVSKTIAGQHFVKYTANCNGGKDNQCKFDITNISIK